MKSEFSLPKKRVVKIEKKKTGMSPGIGYVCGIHHFSQGISRWMDGWMDSR
jgi:hypothetical protein